MRKLILVLLLVVMASAMALAQVTQGATAMTTGTAGAVAPAIDVLGAHQNYGRGCAGCHAPHSGAYGAGGNAASGGTVVDPYTGVNALFAQDMGPLWARRLISAMSAPREARSAICWQQQPTATRHYDSAAILRYARRQ